MKCSDLRPLISAYANDELPLTQKEFIEEHLAGCIDCRAALADYRVTRQRLQGSGTPPVMPDIREVTMSRIKAKVRRTGVVISRWLVTATFVFLIILPLTSIPAISQWVNQAASAESIVKNNAEIRAALNGEPVEIKVTDEVTDESGKLQLAWARTDTEMVVASYDPAEKKVVSVIKAGMIPEFEDSQQQEILKIAKADPGVQELLSQGAAITDARLIHTIELNDVQTGNDGTMKTVTVTFGTRGIVMLKKGLNEWSVTIDPDEGKVTGYGQKSLANRVIDISNTIFTYLNPLLIALSVLGLTGLIFRKKLALKTSGIASIILGIIGIYGGIYAISPDFPVRLLSIIVPLLGLAISLTGIGIKDKGRRIDFIGAVVCTMALIIHLMNFAGSFQVILSIFITVPLVIGIIVFLVYKRTAQAGYGTVREQPVTTINVTMSSNNKETKTIISPPPNIPCTDEKRQNANRNYRTSWLKLVTSTRLAWILLPLLIILLGGTVYAAVTVVKGLFEQYASHIEKTGLAQELDIKQTIDGITVSLERAYADSNVVMVGYAVSGPEESYFALPAELSNLDGTILQGMMGVGAVPGSDMILGSWKSTERTAVIMTYDASAIEGTPEELNLQLIVHVDKNQNIMTTAIENSVGPFIFDFTIPFHGEKKITINKTIEKSGIPITLKDVIITPWATRIDFRIPLIDNEENSQEYYAHLTTNDVTIVFPQTTDSDGNTHGTPDNLTINFCSLPIGSLTLPDGSSYTLSSSKASTPDNYTTTGYFEGDFTSQAGTWTFEISELVSPIMNLQITQSEDGYSKGTGEQKRISGPWIFQFEVPE